MNKLKFQYIPSKVCIKTSFTPIWGAIGEILPISTKFTYFTIIVIVQRVYAILVVKIHIVKIHIVKKFTLKHFNVKPY